MKHQLEADAAQREASRRRPKKAKRPVESSSSEDEAVEIPPQDDSEDDVISEGGDDGEGQLTVGTYIIVKYATKKTSAMFVGQIQSNDTEEDVITVNFLKKRGNQFVWPEDPDIDIVCSESVIRTLKPPRTSGGTARVLMGLTFDEDLSSIHK